MVPINFQVSEANGKVFDQVYSQMFGSVLQTFIFVHYFLQIPELST